MGCLKIQTFILQRVSLGYNPFTESKITSYFLSVTTILRSCLKLKQNGKPLKFHKEHFTVFTLLEQNLFIG
jgi:hypothetical protein